MRIDFHTHTFPSAIAEKALQKLSAASGTPAYTDGTAANLCASMQKAGIDRAVVLPVATHPDQCAHINERSAAAEAEGPLLYFGAIHPDCPDWRAELDRIAALGLRGIKLHPIYQGVDLDDPRYLRILDRAGKLGLLVVTHAGDDVGFPGVRRCTPEMAQNALRQVGPVRLVLAHMGGWRNWERVEALAGEPTVFLDTAFSFGRLPTRADGRFGGKPLELLDEAGFLRLVRAFGAERILFGTDSPWSDQRDSLSLLRAMPLSETERDAILGGNALKLLRIGT